MPKIKAFPANGLLRRGAELQREVVRLLREHDSVVALTDVYTGTPRLFENAADAKRRMREWLPNEKRFHPHAAQYDFEAWLIPYWKTIQTLAGSDRKAPGSQPEQIDHGRPPSLHLREVFRTGSKKVGYVKRVHAAKILDGQDLLVAANACPELKAFLNTILSLCEGDLIA